MQKSVYTTKEWTDLVNKALGYLRTRAEADGTYIGSLKDVMVEFIAQRVPDSRVSGGSIAAMLPLTGLVTNDGRTSGGHTLWGISKENFTPDDLVRVAYLRRQAKQESRKGKGAHQSTKPAPLPQKSIIDETLTGHPEMVTTPERDYKKELEETREKNAELFDAVQNLKEKLEVANDLLKAGLGDTKEIFRLRSLLRNVASDPIAYEAFRAGLELGSNESERR